MNIKERLKSVRQAETDCDTQSKNAQLALNSMKQLLREQPEFAVLQEFLVQRKARFARQVFVS